MLPLRWKVDCSRRTRSPSTLCELCLSHVARLMITNRLRSCSHQNRYHEDVSDWNFGKLSALREISLALEGDYQYYYMGRYIPWKKPSSIQLIEPLARLLHPFMHQDALQSNLPSHVHPRLVHLPLVFWKGLLIVRIHQTLTQTSGIS